MTQPTYTPLQKVILFRDDQPCIGYVCADRFRPSTMDSCVRVTRHYSDAEQGRGTWLHLHKVQPYSDELWAACQQWMQTHTALQDALKQLAKGKFLTVHVDSDNP